MRHLSVFLLSVAFALPAIAQYPAAVINSGGTPPSASANKTDADTQNQPKEEVGYDPKVKRDPNGKVIKDNKKASETAPENPVLRNDKQLKGDSELFKKSN